MTEEELEVSSFLIEIQMKAVLHISMVITNYLDPYSKVKIMGTN